MSTRTANDLDFLLRAFRRNLIGRWSSSWEQGPHPTEEWTFKRDGTGTYSQHSGSGDASWNFCWKEADDFVISVRFEKDQDWFTDMLRLEISEGWARLPYRFIANYYVGIPALVLPLCLFTADEAYFFLVTRPVSESSSTP